MRFVHLFASLLLLAVPFAHAQQHDMRQRVPALTLADIEAAALEHNPDLQTVAARVSTVEARVDGAAAFDDPSVMYRNWGTPLTQPWNVNQAQHMFMFSQTVPGPGKRELRYLAAAEAVDVAKLEIEAKKREIIARVRAAFYRLLGTYDQLRLHDEQVALAQQAFASARIKYTVGRVPQQDVFKAQIAVSRLVDHLVMFQTEAEMARTSLNSLMGRDATAPLEVAGAVPTLLELASFETLKEIALKNRPELLAVEAAIRQAETKAKLAGKAYTPDFSIGVGYMVMPTGSDHRNGYMAEVSMTLPWLNRGKHDADIREARSDVEVLRAEYQSMVFEVTRQIREAVIQAEAAKRKADLYMLTLRPQAQTTLRAAAAAYETDQTDFLNLLDSQTMAIDVQQDYFRAVVDYRSRLAELELAIGADLPGGHHD